ncbi:MAG: hypothetical protein ACXWT3_00730 [Methylococcaceae bacterium]
MTGYKPGAVIGYPTAVRQTANVDPTEIHQAKLAQLQNSGIISGLSLMLGILYPVCWVFCRLALTQGSPTIRVHQMLGFLSLPQTFK